MLLIFLVFCVVFFGGVTCCSSFQFSVWCFLVVSRVAHLFSFLCCVFWWCHVLLNFLVFCVVFFGGVTCCSSFQFSVLCCLVFLRFVCLRPMSCVPTVASVSGLSILDYSFDFL